MSADLTELDDKVLRRETEITDVGQFSVAWPPLDDEVAGRI